MVEKHSIRGAIFDLDGTLFDSMAVWDDYGETYLRTVGKTAKPGIREDMAELSMRQSAEYLRAEYGLTDSVETIQADMNRLVSQFYREVAPLKPGAAEFLHALRAKGIRICIATATDRAPVEAALRRCGIFDCLDRIFTCTEVGAGKQQPTIYRAAMQFLGTERTDTVIFEDALYAIRTAKNDGFLTVALYDDHEPRQAEIHALADCCLTDFTEAERFWDQFAPIV